MVATKPAIPAVPCSCCKQEPATRHDPDLGRVCASCVTLLSAAHTFLRLEDLLPPSLKPLPPTCKD